jgi:hypothetical protein
MVWKTKAKSKIGKFLLEKNNKKVSLIPFNCFKHLLLLNRLIAKEKANGFEDKSEFVIK